MDNEHQITPRLRAVETTVGCALNALCRLQDELESAELVNDIVFQHVVEAYHANLRLAVALDGIKANQPLRFGSKNNAMLVP